VNLTFNLHNSVELQITDLDELQWTIVTVCMCVCVLSVKSRAADHMAYDVCQVIKGTSHCMFIRNGATLDY